MESTKAKEVCPTKGNVSTFPNQSEESCCSTKSVKSIEGSCFSTQSDGRTLYC